MHLLEHPWDAFALFSHDPGFGKGACDQRVPACVEWAALSEALEGDRRYEIADADHFEAIVVHPHFDAAGLVGVVAVRDGVDECLLPREGRVLGHLVEEEVV